MTTPILDPTVPQAAADWLESPGVRWVRRRAAPAAPAAASALVVRDLIGQHGFTADDYRALTARWASVVGPVHPDDVRDGLVAS